MSGKRKRRYEDLGVQPDGTFVEGTWSGSTADLPKDELARLADHYLRVAAELHEALRRRKHEARDAEVVQRAASGETTKTIARTMKLTPGNVRLILSRAGFKRRK